MKQVMGKVNIRKYVFWLYRRNDIEVLFYDGLWKMMTGTEACVLDSRGACTGFMHDLDKAYLHNKINKNSYREFKKEFSKYRKRLDNKELAAIVVFRQPVVDRWVIWHEVGHLVNVDGSEYAAHMWALRETERRGYHTVYGELVSALETWPQRSPYSKTKKKLKSALRYKQAQIQKRLARKTGKS